MLPHASGLRLRTSRSETTPVRRCRPCLLCALDSTCLSTKLTVSTATVSRGPAQSATAVYHIFDSRNRAADAEWHGEQCTNSKRTPSGPADAIWSTWPAAPEHAGRCSQWGVQYRPARYARSSSNERPGAAVHASTRLTGEYFAAASASAGGSATVAKRPATISSFTAAGTDAAHDFKQSERHAPERDAFES